MTSMWELFTKEDLSAAIEAGLINRRESSFGWGILNYSDRAMYTPGSWDNSAVRSCRGLIVDEDDNIRARGWAKFHNYGQSEADNIDLDESVEATDKADGSLGILFKNPSNQLQVATRGSFSSHQAEWATEWIRNNPVIGNWATDFTPLVEIIYPENRIVLNYGDFEGLILLGGIVTSTGTYIGPNTASDLIEWTGRVTEVFPYKTLRQALEALPRNNAEGLVVRATTGNTNRMLKLKQQDYVDRHRIIFGMSERVIWDWRMSNPYPVPIEDIMVGIPDEIHDWIRKIDNRIQMELAYTLNTVDEVYQGFLQGREAESVNRKEAASVFLSPENRPISSYLFMRLDGRDPTYAIMKSLKPEGSTKAEFNYGEIV